MRLAILCDHDIELLNGASLQARSFLSWLSHDGHEIQLIYPSRKRKRSMNLPRIAIHTIPAFAIPVDHDYCVPIPPLAVSLWTKKWDVDIVHAETSNPALLLLGYWIRSRCRIPMFNVLTTNIPYYSPLLFPRDSAATKTVHHMGKRLMNWISNRIDGTFVLSPGMRKTLTQDFFSIDQTRVFPLIRPLVTGIFACQSRSTSFWSNFPAPKGLRLVTLSRLCPTKSVDFLIRTFAREIYPRNNDLHFVVGGGGHQEGILRKQAADLGCPNISFTGAIPREAVPAFLGDADFFLFGSQSETFGNVICEAKFAGLPVIAVDDAGGVRAQVVDGQTGILVRHPDEKEFARRFFELFADTGLQKRISREGRRDVEVNHSPDKIYNNLLRIYFRTTRGWRPEVGEVARAFSLDRSFLDPHLGDTEGPQMSTPNIESFGHPVSAPRPG